MTNYGIGDKVVCVDDKFPPDISKLYTALPVKDATYVVRDIRLGINLTMEGDVSVLLIGLVNPKADSKANLERARRSNNDYFWGRATRSHSLNQPVSHQHICKFGVGGKFTALIVAKS